MNKSVGILCEGGGSWLFEPLARQLSTSLRVEIVTEPSDFNYLLITDQFNPEQCGELFIYYQAMQLASDKRLLANAFQKNHVPIPETRICDTLEIAQQHLTGNADRQWCLKYPTGCGASGHRMLTQDIKLPKSWPFPLLVQEFVPMASPEVFRTYGAGGSLFGWVARRFPGNVTASPWVAHARGARYEHAGDIPEQAAIAATSALEATGLLGCFGCVDLIRRQDGEWLVLEVGTDGMFFHVDRDIGIPNLEREIERRVAEAFWSRFNQI